MSPDINKLIFDIADGHHRLASSLRNNKNAMCLAYIVSKNELQTFPFHRKITNIKKVALKTQVAI